MAPAITQVSNGLNGSPRGAKRSGRTKIKPIYVGAMLLTMYVVFIYLIWFTFEDGPTRDSGAANLLSNSPAARALSSSKQLANAGRENNLDQPSSSISIEEEHLAHHWCGKCLWRDTTNSCDDRVKWEIEHKQASKMESMKRNSIYCITPTPEHVTAFCGSCQWKETKLTCDGRVVWEMEHYKISTLEAKKRNMPYCKKPPYILSPICGGCSRALSKMTSKAFRYGVPCTDVMIRRMNQAGLSVGAAAKAVTKEFDECSALCQPETCWKSYFEELSMSVDGLDSNGKGYLTKYWRFDQVAPKFSTPTTLVLPSIPEELRIPPSRFHDIESVLTEKYTEYEGSDDIKFVRIFIEYNPALAPIPPKMKKYLPKYAAYAVVFRVTPANNCFRREQMKDLPQNVWDHTMMSPTNLMGIALLDEYYNMLPGYDIIVDIATQLGFVKDGYGTTYFGEPTFMDYRLFTLNDAIYLHTNADVTVVTKLDIRDKKHTRGKWNKKEEFKLDIVYGEDNLEVTMLHQFNTIWSGGERGKNFALFAIPNATHPWAPDSIYAEVEINPYHQVQQVYLDEFEMVYRSQVKKRIRRNYSVDKIMMRRVRTNDVHNGPQDIPLENITGNLIVSEIEPDPSFFTADELWFPRNRPSFRRTGHGGACCVSLSRREVLAQGDNIHLTDKSWGDNDYLLVGVAHTSVTWRRWHSDKNINAKEKALVPHTHYVSFFYAFEPRPPFNLRARSGYFCLGFAGEHDDMERGMFNPHSILTRNRVLSQHNETFDCPQIHFICSFIEKVGDPSTTVIGYGINDCTPRIVEVSKKEISRMLFSDPWEMKIERESSDFDRNQSEHFVFETPVGWM